MRHVDSGAEPAPLRRTVVVSAAGDDPASVSKLEQDLWVALGEQPLAIVCDLAAVRTVTPELLEVLRPVVRYLRDWPGTPVGISCPDARVRNRLLRTPPVGRLLIDDTGEGPSALLDHNPATEHAQLLLEPGLTAPRSARAFVVHTFLDWQARSVIGHACLVTSELVTNALLHADSLVDLTLSRCPGRLRIAVRDIQEVNGRAAPVPGGFSGTGRGLLVVSSFCRAWGVQPTAVGGKWVWAVLDDAGGPDSG